MTQPCSETNPEALAGADIEDDWDLDPGEEGDGGFYDKALDAFDRQVERDHAALGGHDG